MGGPGKELLLWALAFPASWQKTRGSAVASFFRLEVGTPQDICIVIAFVLKAGPQYPQPTWPPIFWQPYLSWQKGGRLFSRESVSPDRFMQKVYATRSP